MAERTSTRTTSRRTTPQPVPGTARVAASQSPPKRTTRVTRSQSRDISDSDATRKGASLRRSAKQGAAEGTDSSTGKVNTKGQKGRPANKSASLQGILISRNDEYMIVSSTMLSSHGATKILPQSQKIRPLSTPISSVANRRGLSGLPSLDIAFPMEVRRFQSLLGEFRLSPEPLRELLFLYKMLPTQMQWACSMPSQISLRLRTSC